MKLKTKFRDENFDSGEVLKTIINIDIYDNIEVIVLKHSGETVTYQYNSLKDFKDHWEEPKEFYWYDECGEIDRDDICETFKEDIQKQKQIGNYFETREEAEAAVEKLKAWKRLKEKGFSFIGVRTIGKVIDYDISGIETKTLAERMEINDDLTFLFGGEE